MSQPKYLECGFVPTPADTIGNFKSYPDEKWGKKISLAGLVIIPITMTITKNKFGAGTFAREFAINES